MWLFLSHLTKKGSRMATVVKKSAFELACLVAAAAAFGIAFWSPPLAAFSGDDCDGPCNSWSGDQYDRYGDMECQHGPEHDPDCPLNGKNNDGSNACEDNGGDLIDDPDPMTGDGVCNCFDCNSGASTTPPSQNEHCERLLEFHFAYCEPDNVGDCPIVATTHFKYDASLAPGETECNGGGIVHFTLAAACGFGGANFTGSCISEASNCTYDSASKAAFGSGTKCAP